LLQEQVYPLFTDAGLTKFRRTRKTPVIPLSDFSHFEKHPAFFVSSNQRDI